MTQAEDRVLVSMATAHLDLDGVVHVLQNLEEWQSELKPAAAQTAGNISY